MFETILVVAAGVVVYHLVGTSVALLLNKRYGDAWRQSIVAQTVRVGVRIIAIGILFIGIIGPPVWPALSLGLLVGVIWGVVHYQAVRKYSNVSDRLPIMSSDLWAQLMILAILLVWLLLGSSEREQFAGVLLIPPALVAAVRVNGIMFGPRMVISYLTFLPFGIIVWAVLPPLIAGTLWEVSHVAGLVLGALLGCKFRHFGTN